MNRNILQTEWQIQNAINALLIQINNVEGDEEFNDWLKSFKIVSAQKEDEFKKLLEGHNFSNPETKQELGIEVESIKARKSVYDMYLQNSPDDELEGYLLDRLININKELNHLMSISKTFETPESKEPIKVEKRQVKFNDDLEKLVKVLSKTSGFTPMTVMQELLEMVDKLPDKNEHNKEYYIESDHFFISGTTDEDGNLKTMNVGILNK